ncbi:hypothetical protein PITC_083820 [Penicillium italicum]|uniref:Uncharacterized protein n=1 Tax=Penicillium italicum TaxID=40296 RepID=A0A0A2L6E9_PENIT|nr:hypothetical protein PITC_083820 [Penicillium italicum]
MDLDTADLVLQTALQEVEEAFRSLKKDEDDGRVRVGDQNLALSHWQAELQRRMRIQQDRQAAIQISRESRFDQAAILQDIHNREGSEAAAVPVLPAGRAPPRPQVPQTRAPRGTLDLTSNPDAQDQAGPRADATTTPTAPSTGALREIAAHMSTAKHVSSTCFKIPWLTKAYFLLVVVAYLYH